MVDRKEILRIVGIISKIILFLLLVFNISALFFVALIIGIQFAEDHPETAKWAATLAPLIFIIISVIIYALWDKFKLRKRRVRYEYRKQ